ncbi:MAG TPA: hypothetical protein VK254_00125 [Candidatus Bathyarchaeia archaeon]|nr:hypothetical protein [Candidatus Bathyarchaeia archaeon]
MLFFGDPGIDLLITAFLLGVCLIISLIVLALAKRKILALIVFSVLANLSIWLNIGSGMFGFYSIMWLKYFSVFIWPILNIFLIIYYVRTGARKK